MEYLNAKDIGTQTEQEIKDKKPLPKFRFLSTEGKHRKKTNYDYWLKNKKTYSLVVENEEEKTFSAWVDGGFQEIDKSTLFGKNKEGKKVLLLIDVYNFECQFEKHTEITDKRGTRTVDVFNFEASWSQNKLIEEQLEMYGLKKYYTWKKQGRPWFLFEQGDVPEDLTKTSTLSEKLAEEPKVVEQVKEVVSVEKIIDVQEEITFTMKEKAFLSQARKEKLTDTQFKDFLEGEKIVEDRINLLLVEFIE